jgi:uncharacterized protein (DUF2236 family)
MVGYRTGGARSATLEDPVMTCIGDGLRNLLADVRAGWSSTLVERVAGPDAVNRRRQILDAPGEPWFAPGSPVRVVHGDAAMFVGGLLAVLRQTAHPLAMAGVAQHSRFREDPWGRLHRTGHFLGAITFGSRDVAERAVAQVRAIHDRVRGVDEQGRAYAANDPHLLLWVHCAELESFVTAHRAYGSTRLEPEDYDRYVAEMGAIAEALGSEPPPRSRAELRDALRAFQPELAVTADARRAARYLILPPGLSLPERIGYAPLVAAAIALLPLDIRFGLRLPVTLVSDRVVVPPMTAGTLRVARWIAA